MILLLSCVLLIYDIHSEWVLDYCFVDRLWRTQFSRAHCHFSGVSLECRWCCCPNCRSTYRLHTISLFFLACLSLLGFVPTELNNRGSHGDYDTSESISTPGCGGGAALGGGVGSTMSSSVNDLQHDFQRVYISGETSQVIYLMIYCHVLCYIIYFIICCFFYSQNRATLKIPKFMYSCAGHWDCVKCTCTKRSSFSRRWPNAHCTSRTSLTTFQRVVCLYLLLIFACLLSNDLLLLLGHHFDIVNYDEPPVIADPWNINIPGDYNCILKTENGVIFVYKNADDLRDGKSMHREQLFMFVCNIYDL